MLKHLIKTLILPVCLALASTQTGFAQSERYKEVNVAPGANVNVRAEPRVAEGNVVGKALAGNTALVLSSEDRGAYTWYELRAVNGSFEGWIRGDLLKDAEAPAAEPLGDSNPVAALPDNGGQDEPPAASGVPADPQVPERSGWTVGFEDFVEAARSCVETGSAQPAVAVEVNTLQRGLVEVDVLDAANRQWKCVVRQYGGTPLRFDPTYAGDSASRRKGPLFASSTTGMPAITGCEAIEPISTGEDEELAGWLIYTDCP